MGIRSKRFANQLLTRRIFINLLWISALSFSITCFPITCILLASKIIAANLSNVLHSIFRSHEYDLGHLTSLRHMKMINVEIRSQIQIFYILERSWQFLGRPQEYQYYSYSKLYHIRLTYAIKSLFSSRNTGIVCYWGRLSYTNTAMWKNVSHFVHSFIHTFI